MGTPSQTPEQPNRTCGSPGPRTAPIVGPSPVSPLSESPSQNLPDTCPGSSWPHRASSTAWITAPVTNVCHSLYHRLRPRPLSHLSLSQPMTPSVSAKLTLCQSLYHRSPSQALPWALSRHIIQGSVTSSPVTAPSRDPIGAMPRCHSPYCGICSGSCVTVPVTASVSVHHTPPRSHVTVSTALPGALPALRAPQRGPWGHSSHYTAELSLSGRHPAEGSCNSRLS